MKKEDRNWFIFEPQEGVKYRYDYAKIADDLNQCKLDNDRDSAIKIMRTFSSKDLFFLMNFMLNIPGINRKWVVERIYEVDDRTHNTMNLWPRGHYKSTTLTYAKPIQKMLNNPEERQVIFSHTKGIATAFLDRIKQTLETNILLKHCFPEVLYYNPENESPLWSSSKGIIVKRKGAYTEASFEAWGVIENMPTGKHYTSLIYDDLVTPDSVATAEQIEKVESGYRMSLNLVSEKYEKQLAGTHYNQNDLYMTLKKDDGYLLRQYPATHNGREDGVPVMLSMEELAQKRKEMGPYVFSSQMLLRPVPEELQTFNVDWLKTYRAKPPKLNYYIIVDPANEKRKDKASPDFSVFLVVGVDQFRRKYLLDGSRDRLSLKDRWETLVDFYIRWQPKGIGYERYGMQCDIDYFYEKMREEGIYFDVAELGNVKVSKSDKIKQLVPEAEQGRLFIPESMPRVTKTGEQYDLVKILKNELQHFPAIAHDDVIDCLSMIKDPKLNVAYPYNPAGAKEKTRPELDPLNMNKKGGTRWQDL